ncbi:hypothetical protein RDWZM_001771 [Blomia tropicalis]|uniref:General transcription factor 3C polypeptide 3 n=1 Tax=Blomia tropicalis TaxID=40697 RepID=A0A9Q0RRL6_BLOTA|nr:hypothetical protein RDWZM_001771 [Blomia tropicalis]
MDDQNGPFQMLLNMSEGGDAGPSQKRNVKGAKQRLKKKIRASKKVPIKGKKVVYGSKKSELLTFEEQQEIEEPVEIDLRNIYKAYGINPIEAGRQKLFRKTSNDIIEFSIGEANMKFSMDKPEEAINLLFEVIRMNPFISEPYDALGDYYMRMGNYQKALEFYLLGIEFNQNDSKRWLQLAEIADLNGMHKSAIEFYTKAIKLNPKSIKYQFKKCNLLEQTKQYVQAFKTYEKLLQTLQQSQDSDYRIVLSIVFRMVGILIRQPNKAQKALEMVENILKVYQIETDQERFESFISFYVESYFDLLFLNGQHMKVLTKMFKFGFLSINPELNTEEMNASDLVETILNNFSSLKLVGKKTMDEDTANDDNLLLKSKFVCVFIHLRKFDLIDSYLKEFESLEEQSLQETIFPCLVEALIKSEQYNMAHQFVSKLVDLNKSSSRYWYLYGLCLSKICSTDELEKAIEAFEAAILYDRNNYDAVNELSDICNLIGNPERALDNVNLMERSQTVVDFKLLHNRCNLLFICKRYDEFITSSRLLLSSTMHFFRDWTEIHDLIHPSLSLGSLIRSSKRLYRRYSKRNIPIKLSGGQLTGEQYFELWKKSVFVMLNYTKQYDDAVRFAFSSILSSHFKQFSLPFILIIFRCCLDAKSQQFTYELARFLVKEYPMSGKIWYAFSVTMNDIYHDFRHKRFCMRIWKSHPDNVNILMMNGHIALLNGRYRHALAIFLLVYRQRTYRYDSFYIGLCYLHLLMQSHTLDKCSLFAQMITFFHDYVQKIGKCQESYYNLGRVYHQLGFYRHAIDLYSVALHTPLKIHDKRFDLAPEIAFNLSQIYRRSGNHRQANQLIVQYCTI